MLVGASRLLADECEVDLAIPKTGQSSQAAASCFAEERDNTTESSIETSIRRQYECSVGAVAGKDGWPDWSGRGRPLSHAKSRPLVVATTITVSMAWARVEVWQCTRSVFGWRRRCGALAIPIPYCTFQTAPAVIAW